MDDHPTKGMIYGKPFAKAKVFMKKRDIYGRDFLSAFGENPQRVFHEKRSLQKKTV